MTTRRKALILIVAAIAVLILVLYGTLQWILLRGFAAVEEDSTKQNVERAINAFSAELAYLDSKASDWSNWDDTYTFIADGNPEYVKSNLTDETFVDLGLNLMFFVRPSGQLRLGKAYDLEDKKAIEIPPALLQQLSSDSLLLQPPDNKGSRTGLLLLPEGPVAVVLRPILTSKSTGPSHGTLIMGRYLDAALVGQLSQTTHLALDMRGVEDTEMPADMQVLKHSFSLPNEVFIRPRDRESIAGYAMLNDLYGQPALLLRVTTSRPIYQQGQATMEYILWALIAVGLVFGSALVVLVDRLVRAWQAHKESEERYTLAVRGANDGVWDWNMRTQTVYYSPRWKSILGWQSDEIGTSPDEWFSRIHSDDQARVKTEIAAHLAGRSKYLESEQRMQQRNGDYIWVLSRGLAVRGKDGAVYRMAGSLSDISSRKAALHDALTGLPNRTLFNDRLGQAIERAKRVKCSVFAVLYLDLDGFKLVNDSFGHATGDRLLVASAHRLQMCLRATDTVARLGGDEFVILAEDIHECGEATRAAERILSEMELPFYLDRHQVRISTSIGVVLGGENYEHAEQVLRDADIAMYRAKSGGKSRFQVFDDAMRNRALARLEIEGSLRDALERHEFELHYQPVFRLENNQLVGFEALVRWRHPERGLILPGEFIPVAEETGLILPLDDWVLHAACAQMRQWQAEHPVNPPLYISVNLSPSQFTHPSLPDHIQGVLRETNLPARCLHLEITERVIMNDVGQGTETLKRLQAMGIQVEIDDFGTGYSSLIYLQQLPINALKIERTFISRMSARANGSGSGIEIVRTLLTLAHQLGLKVIAEGVETKDQLTLLQEMDCEYGQGHLFARAMRQDQVEALLRRTEADSAAGVDASPKSIHAQTPNSVVYAAGGVGAAE